MNEYDVIILGAGMAGLTAARALAERNQRVLVLEARDRVGGRILTHQIDGQTIELGAEFVHGRSPELFALIAEANLETTERAGTMLRQNPNGGFDDDDDEEEDFFAPLADLDGHEQPDETFNQWLSHSSVPPEQRPALTSYIEGFNAADASVIGVQALAAQQKAEDAIEGDRAWHVRGGYAQLADYLAARVRELRASILLNSAATEVRWSQRRAEIVTSDGDVYRAPRCIITLPLGVLQHHAVRFTPEPMALAHASRLAMGDAARFTMVFRDAWWQASSLAPQDDLQHLHFVFTRGDAPNVWWTAYPEPEAAPTLTGWAGGPRAAALRARPVNELAAKGCRELASAFGIAEETVAASLVSAHVHDWWNDPHACGAYSYVPAGALDAPAAMGIPEADTLFFAGEHTDTTAHWGTVHAAIRSGLRAAAQILGED